MCEQAADGHQHILRECMHLKMRACRRRWETAICGCCGESEGAHGNGTQGLL